MKLIAIIDEYIVLQQSLGMRSETARRTLRQFARRMGDIRIDEVQAQQVLEFLHGSRALSSTWRVKYRLLSGLYRYAISRGHVSDTPLPPRLPKFPPPRTPYVYSTDELRRLLEAASCLHASTSRQQAPMFRSLLLLLYGCGMRVGEALGLTLRDVDFVQRIITVRDTKFFKTRLVPFGPKLALELTAHADRRRRLAMPAGEDSAFFSTRTGAAWPYQRLITLFQRVRRVAGIVRPAGELRPPRSHDLRHTAAVHRVLSWYRSGRDVQRLLLQLATYLGHVDISSTQRYLQMTPALLEQASQRFDRYANCGGGHE